MDSESPAHSEPILLRVFRVGFLVYVGVMMLLAIFQRQLLYFPTRLEESDALKTAKESKLEPWRDAQGALIGWRARNPQAKASLLVFHGNAGCALDRDYYVDLFSRLKTGNTWEVFLFEYPGYGARPGTPGEEAFISARKAAYRQLKGESSRPLAILGESLGSGLACALAAEGGDEVAGLLLVTPFTSLPDVAAYHYPLFPVRTLMRDRFDNLAALKKYHGPLAVILAGKDEVVPTRIGQRLFDSYQGPKQLWVAPKGTHNDVVNDISLRDWEAITRFLLSSPKSGSGVPPLGH